jgi:hypothetical protein
VIGLYTSALPPMVYAWLGTSNVCSIGPNALVRRRALKLKLKLKRGVVLF